jgi:TPR repeat protein
MRDGVAVVAYDCHALKLLRGCRIDSSYGFMAFSRKEETIRFENADEVAANLPTFGIPLIQGLGGELKRDSTIDLAMILIGKKRTTVQQATPEKLLGGAACGGATHFVRGAFVGAFAMGTGTKGGASLGTGLFTAGSTSSKLASYRDGDPASCQQVTTSSASPPDACDALVRLELVALGAAGTQTKPTAGDDQTRAQTCPQGLVLAEGKCVPPSPDKPHRCKPDDVADCTAQCTLKDAASCTNLGFLYSTGKGVTKDDAKAFALYQQACDAGDAHGCSDLGVEYRNGRGVEKDDVKAAALFKQGCDGGFPQGCANLGVAYLTGRGVQEDDTRGLALFQQACDGGNAIGCSNLGVVYERGQGAPKDPAKAVGLYKRACDGGNVLACANLAAMYDNGAGVAEDDMRAVALYETACDGGSAVGCSRLGFMFENGTGVKADRAEAVRLYRQGCRSAAQKRDALDEDNFGCDQLKRLGETP